MNKATKILCITAVAVLTAWGSISAQDSILSLSSPAFGTWRRPPAQFKHDEHNAKAGLGDCAACHHAYDKGKRLPGQDSAGTPCADCHAVKGGNGAEPLMRAYHRQCMDCHQAKGKGPATCAECHPKAVRR